MKAAKKKVSAKIEKLKADKWLKVKIQRRRLSLKIDKAALKEISRLDGCYAIKTDLPKTVADKEIVHGRYKDLAEVRLPEVLPHRKVKVVSRRKLPSQQRLN